MLKCLNSTFSLESADAALKAKSDFSLVAFVALCRTPLKYYACVFVAADSQLLVRTILAILIFDNYTQNLLLDRK